jgi:dTDP-4-amino-4,6-dideoxygalactose transaminase
MMYSNLMNVPYFDLKAQYAELRGEICAAIDRVCQNASFILGEEVTKFEHAFATYCEAKHCVALNSGTSALHLALLSAGIGPGDEVITTANTFLATAEAICYTGATPVFTDIDPATANLDPPLIESAITQRSKAVVPVHLYGRPADLDPILDIAERHRLVVIEDACQAHGARYCGKRVGSFGHAAVFSFYPGKNLGAYGEGGALTTNDDAVAQFAREMRTHGESKRYFHDRVGYNYRMDGFQGAVLNIKLKYLDRWTAQRQEFAKLYRERLAGSQVRIPEDRLYCESVYHLFTPWVQNRDAVREELARHGVQTAVHYPVPVHLQKAYSHLGYKPGSLPHTEKACAEVISMPLFPEMSSEQVLYAADALAEIVERLAAA